MTDFVGFSSQTGVLRMPRYEIHIEVVSDGEDPSRRPGQPHVLRRRSAGSEAMGQKQECHVTEAGELIVCMSDQRGDAVVCVCEW